MMLLGLGEAAGRGGETPGRRSDCPVHSPYRLGAQSEVIVTKDPAGDLSPGSCPKGRPSSLSASSAGRFLRKLLPVMRTCTHVHKHVQLCPVIVSCHPEAAASSASPGFLPASSEDSSEEETKNRINLYDDVAQEILDDLQVPNELLDSLMDLTLVRHGRLRLTIHLLLGCF